MQDNCKRSFYVCRIVFKSKISSFPFSEGYFPSFESSVLKMCTKKNSLHCFPISFSFFFKLKRWSDFLGQKLYEIWATVKLSHDRATVAVRHVATSKANHTISPMLPMSVFVLFGKSRPRFVHYQTWLFLLRLTFSTGFLRRTSSSLWSGSALADVATQPFPFPDQNVAFPISAANTSFPVTKTRGSKGCRTRPLSHVDFPSLLPDLQQPVFSFFNLSLAKHERAWQGSSEAVRTVQR